MPLACFPPKVASTIKIQILAPKSTQGPQGPPIARMCKTKSKFSKHKNSDNSEAIGSSDLKLSQKLLTTGARHPAKFQLPTPSGSKVIAKKVHSHSFQDHYIKLYSILHNWFISRPLH